MEMLLCINSEHHYYCLWCCCVCIESGQFKPVELQEMRNGRPGSGLGFGRCEKREAIGAREAFCVGFIHLVGRHYVRLVRKRTKLALKLMI